MSAIDLTRLRFQEAEPIPRRFGGTNGSPFGGSEEQVDRLGDRWSFRFVTRPYAREAEGRRFEALLRQAEKAGGIFSILPPAARVVDYGSPTVASDTAAGKSLPITGGFAGRAIQAGQWASVIQGGQRYLDMLAADVITGTSGVATLTLCNLIRKSITAGATVELTEPKIEGRVLELSAPWRTDRMMQFAFSVSETG